MFNLSSRRTPKPKSNVDKTNVNPALDKDTHKKLKRLAASCDMTKTKMAEVIIRMSVNNSDIVNHYQDLFNNDNDFRIIVVTDGDKITYC